MTRSPATYADVETAPEHARAELLDGELFLQAQPSVEHQSVLTVLSAELRAAFGRAGSEDGGPPTGWMFLVGPELWLGASDPRTTVLVPDLAGWRRDRFPRVREAHGLTVAPDWVCEILSPATHRHDRLRKAEAYADAGIEWYWLIDPHSRFVEVYARRDGLWTRVAAAAPGEPTSLPPFEAPPRDIGEWWSDLDAVDG